MLMEAFVPHKATGMVWSVWHCCEQARGWLFDHFTIIEDHPVSVHVSHTAEHVAKSILACVDLGLCPAILGL